MFKSCLLTAVCILAIICKAQCALKNTTLRPWNIAHRGSSGMLPQHSTAAYQLAIDQGADVIECDVSITKDLQFVCLHESWMSKTTNIAELSQFKGRNNSYYPGIQHGRVNDWFTVDFSLEELQDIRLKQLYSFRDQNFNGNYAITTLESFIKIAKSANRPVAIYPEVKDPAWVNSLDIMRGKRFEDLLVEFLHNHDYKTAEDYCLIQSFDAATVEYLSQITSLRLVQLTALPVTDQQLETWKKYVYAVSPSKKLILNGGSFLSGDKTYLKDPTDLIGRLKQKGFKVHPYTFKAEDRYLAHDHGQDVHAEFEMFVKLGVDGMFTDHPASLSRFYKSKYGKQTEPVGLFGEEF